MLPPDEAIVLMLALIYHKGSNIFATLIVL